MTSFAFILGVVPLMIATGAGAEMRRALGIAVFSGMLGVTIFGIFFTPVFFHLIDRLAEIEFDAKTMWVIFIIFMIVGGVLTLGLVPLIYFLVRLLLMVVGYGYRLSPVEAAELEHEDELGDHEHHPAPTWPPERRPEPPWRPPEPDSRKIQRHPDDPHPPPSDNNPK
jgi:hypothetical protein